MARNYFTTFTVTVASPAVFTATEHNLYIGDEVILATTGTLPTGLSASTSATHYPYYVIPDGIGVNTFQLSTGKDGTAINTTGTQSGVHTFLKLGGSKFTHKGISYI